MRGVINSPITQGLILVLAFWVGWSAYVRYDIATDMLDRSTQAEQKAEALKTKKDELEKQVEYLSSERGIEAEMRRQFDVALPGEQVVVIVDKEEDEIMPMSTSTNQVEAKWYQFWR